MPITDVGSFHLPHGSSHWALAVVMQGMEDRSTVPVTDYLFLISWVFSLSSDQKDEGLWPNGSFHCLDSSSSEAQGPALEKKRKETKDIEASSFEVKQGRRKPYPLYRNAALQSQSCALWFWPELTGLAPAQDITSASPEGLIKDSWNTCNPLVGKLWNRTHLLIWFLVMLNVIIFIFWHSWLAKQHLLLVEKSRG